MMVGKGKCNETDSEERKTIIAYHLSLASRTAHQTQAHHSRAQQENQRRTHWEEREKQTLFPIFQCQESLKLLGIQ